jgi:phosphoserine aminotransferase
VKECLPLVDDCSSNFLTRPIPWAKVSVAYSHAQKNCGISGVTIMIVDDAFLKTNPCSSLPVICDFKVYREKGGFPFPISGAAVYAMMRMSDHMLHNGGVQPQRFTTRSNKLYNVLDKHPIYLPKVNKAYRSRINVTWDCVTP